MTLTPDNNTDPWATTHEYRAILRELAEKATPGPWFAKQLIPMARPELLAALDRVWLHPDGSPDQREYFYLSNRPGADETDGRSPCQTGNGPTSAANARFIAAANPAVVLTLLDEVELLCLEVERLRAENERLRSGSANLTCTPGVLPPLEWHIFKDEEVRTCCVTHFTEGGRLQDRMICCPECGSKRCPKAENCAAQCAGEEA